MYYLRNYTNTKCELEMAKTRLNLLMDRKERLYCKYFPLTPQLKDTVVDGGEQNKDKMAEYLSELHDVDIGTGKSLAQELKEEQQNVEKLQGYLNNMNNTLSKMIGIEYQLFYEIVYKGVKITKAVENVASANNVETQTVWKNHYRKISYYIKRIQNFVKIQ